MSIKLAVAGRPQVEIQDEHITLGSDPHCTVVVDSTPQIKPKHAIIRKIAGRWLIEVRDGESVFVGGPEPRRLHWLNPGDVIRLCEQSPDIVFQPASTSSPPPIAPKPPAGPPPIVPKASATPHHSDHLLPPASDHALPTAAPADDWTRILDDGPAEPSSRAPLSSHPVPVSKPGSSSKIPTYQPDSGAFDDEFDSPKHDSPQPHSASKSNHAAAADEGAEQRPMLQRGVIDLAGFEPTEGSKEDSELKWVMKVVGYAFGAGFIFILIYMVISAMMKGLAPVQIPAVESFPFL